MEDDLNLFSELPTNYDEYISFMGITEWPGKLTSETILPFRDELSDYLDINLIRNELDNNIAISFSAFDNFSESLAEHDKYLMKYANQIWDVERLLSPIKKQDKKIYIEKFEKLGEKVRQTSEQVASRLDHKPASYDPLQELNLKSAELYQYAGFDETKFNELPGTADALAILRLTGRAVKVAVSFRKCWRSILASPASVGIVVDLFWWLFLDYFRDEKDCEDKEKLFCRIARHFGILLMSLPDDVARQFFPTYPDTVAMALYSMFYHAFPASRKLFGPEFKQKVVNTCHLWMHGLQPLPNSFQSWPIDKLESSQIDQPLELQSTDRPRSGLPHMQTGIHQSSLAFTNILFDPKGCSPLMHKFLQLNGIEPTRSDVSRCITRLQCISQEKPSSTITNQMSEYRQRKQERQANHDEINRNNESQMQQFSRERLKLEKRFNELQKNIDSCGSLLDMRKLLDDFTNL